jgi:cysteine synthase
MAPYWHLHSGEVTQDAAACGPTAMPGLQLAALPVGQDTEQEPQLPVIGVVQEAPSLVWRLMVRSLARSGEAWISTGAGAASAAAKKLNRRTEAKARIVFIGLSQGDMG